ncbi:MAG: transporter substrate-binding domain-containing protein [Paraglaciecola sp.]|uniref:transporter substrate-binding domain-containing protein n=1 Tax=Paraglaciecola sp. TaxID=1920173 RepID=UPI00329710D3
MKLVILIIYSLFTLSVAAATSVTVKLPSINSKDDFRHQYSQQLQKLILSSSGSDVKIEWVTFPNEQQHLSLLDNHAVDIFASATDKKLEKRYHAIRYPIFKGLMGYRLILVRKNDRDILANVKDINDLKKFTVGQGSQWQETKIYSESGFVVNTSRHYNHLFEMLSKQRFDLFPRSVLEVWNEAKTFSNRNIVIEPHVALHYPMSIFYFVRKDHDQLIQLLENGFKVAVDNGSFDALFEKHHTDLIKRAKLDKRTLIEIPNPFSAAISSQETPLYINL